LPQTLTSNARIYSVIAFVCGALAFVVVPPLFGVASLSFAFVAQQKHDPLAKYAAILGVVGLIAGIALGMTVWSPRH
jgi:formate hydrogenlyase subunit 3/multisubunit Na+/H+ antiporter MnhD subunit